MSRAYAYEMLRRHDTHICREVGFNGVNGTPKENTKRLFDHAELPINKKPRLEPCKVRSVREMSCVQMTLDGLLIAFREGILPKPWPLDKPFNNLFDESEDETQHSNETPVPILDQFENQSNSDIYQNEQIIKNTMDYSSFHDSLPKYLQKSKYSQYLQNYFSVPSPVASKSFKRPMSNVSVNKTTKPSNQKPVNSLVTLTNKLKLKKLAKPCISNGKRTFNEVTQIKMQEKERDKKFNEESSNLNKYSFEHQTHNTGPINSNSTKPVSASTTPTARFTSLLKSPTVSFPDTNGQIFVEEHRDLEVFQEEMDPHILTSKFNKSASEFVIETEEKVGNNKETLGFNSEMDLSLQEAIITDDESQFLTCGPMSTILPLEPSADTMTKKPSQLPYLGADTGDIEIENGIKKLNSVQKEKNQLQQQNQLSNDKSQIETQEDKIRNKVTLKSDKNKSGVSLPPFSYFPSSIDPISENKLHTASNCITADISLNRQKIDTQTQNHKNKPHQKNRTNEDGTSRKKDRKDKRKDKCDEKEAMEIVQIFKEKKVNKNENHDQNSDALVPKIIIKLSSKHSKKPSLSPPDKSETDSNKKTSIINAKKESLSAEKYSILNELSITPEQNQIPDKIIKVKKQKHRTKKVNPKEKDMAPISDEPAPVLSQLADKPSGPLPTPFYFDDQGNRIWVCPACVQPDDGSPMIGCDTCDDWYHWVCVGIMEDPGATVDWFCKPCINRTNASMFTDSAPTDKKPRRKPKTHNVKQ